MTIPITGGCVCGAVRYQSDAEPLVMVKCHCRDCQLTTGGPFVPAVIFPMAAFRFTQGQVQHFATPSEKGGHNLRGFCPKCGSRITGAEDPQRGIIGVLASSLDDPTLFVPSCDLYVTDAQPWDIMSPETKKFPKGMTPS